MRTGRLDTRFFELRKQFVQSLPGRVAAIVHSLRQRQEDSSEAEGTLDRQFHNLAGTAGTFGLLAIAAVAADGFDECAHLGGARIEDDARYLWSIVEELANEATGAVGYEPTPETVFRSMNELAPMEQTAA